MAWSGGTFTRVGGATAWGDDRDASVEIEAGLHDTHDEDLSTGINACLAKDGSNAATGDLDAGSNKITNVADGVDANDAVNKGQLDAVAAAPTGAIIAYVNTTPPSGWLVCDGSSVAVSTYTALHNVIGDAYGGDGGTNFNLPDLQGKFLRGHDNGAGNDPDAGTRTAQATGGNTGDAVGSVQAEDILNHAHAGTTDAGSAHKHETADGRNFDTLGAVTSNSIQAGASNTGTGTTQETGTESAHTHAFTTDTDGGSTGNETRPINVYAVYLIKT